MWLRENALAARSLREAAMLAAQLRRIVGAAARQPAMGALAAACADLRQQLPTLPPPPKVAARLRRALAAGWADQVLLGC